MFYNTSNTQRRNNMDDEKIRLAGFKLFDHFIGKRFTEREEKPTKGIILVNENGVDTLLYYPGERSLFLDVEHRLTFSKYLSVSSADIFNSIIKEWFRERTGYDARFVN